MGKSRDHSGGDHERSAKRKGAVHRDPERPQKKTKLLLDADNFDEEGSTVTSPGGVTTGINQVHDVGDTFRINQDYARRFQHNKEREELHQLEEKYGKQRSVSARNTVRKDRTMDDEEDLDSSTDEGEDEDGILASEALDAQIDATLQAIRSKDPRVYDEESTFYKDADEESQGDSQTTKRRDKPMYLSDYHRRNLLEGTTTGELDEADKTMTYAQQQEDLKSTIVKEMHAATNGGAHLDNGALASSEANGADDSEDCFLIRKSTSVPDPIKAPPRKIKLDVEAADKDPETYLSNFMAARAWVPSTGSQFQPFESDDEDEEQRAEAFEEAYNLRFENPNTANEKLVSHARDAAVKYSVRKDETNGRKKARDVERAKKEAGKQEREEEKGRLRKLRIAEAEEKVKKIKQAAGLRGKSIKAEDWANFIDDGWDDDRWDEEMKRRFGEEYYNEQDLGEQDHPHETAKVQKPKWEDDIDIKDIVPDFDNSDGKGNAQFAFPDAEEDASSTLDTEDLPENDNGIPVDEAGLVSKKKVDPKRKRDEQKKEARKDRRVIEQLVDEKLNAEDKLSGVGKKKAGHFRYRETSPLTFGLSARDILMAADSQLNQYAGLKKMAAFRDPAKKRKDKKQLGKKARLREWRKETFGNEEGPQQSLAELFTEQGAGATPGKSSNRAGAEIREDKRQHKHVRDGKASKPRSGSFV